jgi:hypothetical protein
VHDAHLCVVELYLYGSEPLRPHHRLAEELRTVADRLGARGAAFATTMLGEAELLSGQLDRAERHLTKAAGLHRQIGAAGGVALSLQRLAEVHVAAGRTADAEAVLDDALDAARLSRLPLDTCSGGFTTSRIRAADDPAGALALVDEAEVAIRGRWRPARLHPRVRRCPPRSRVPR